MKVVIRCLLLLLAAGWASAQEPDALDKVVRSYADAHRFMGAVLVARGDELLLDKGYGSANLEWNIPNAPDTKFRLGSLTKQFTAAAVLLLEEQGKLKVDDPVRKYLPEAPATWDGMTLFHLLTHTAGVPNFTSWPDYPETKLNETSPGRRLAALIAKPLDFEPGERMRYSNTGYVLLGIIIERVSAKSYPDFLRDAIFIPNEMRDTGYDLHATVLPKRATGYGVAPAGLVNAPYIDMTVPFSAGSLYSTTHDLLKWQRALFGGKVLSAASLRKMTTPFKNDYAFGLTRHVDNGRTLLMHTGEIEGFNTYLAYFPDSRISVVVLGNQNGPAPAQIGGRLGALVHGGEVLGPLRPVDR